MPPIPLLMMLLYSLTLKCEYIILICSLVVVVFIYDMYISLIHILTYTYYIYHDTGPEAPKRVARLAALRKLSMVFTVTSLPVHDLPSYTVSSLLMKIGEFLLIQYIRWFILIPGISNLSSLTPFYIPLKLFQLQ